MEIRGDRECKACGTRWSYYETGSVACPECGSLRSVGTDDERAYHTDLAPDLDLAEAHRLATDATLTEAAEAASSAASEYVRQRGFVAGGDLRDLDDTYLAARELAYVGAEYARAIDHSEDQEFYLLSLVRGAPEGKRPEPADVPADYISIRGLAYAAAVGDYRKEIRAWYDVERGDDVEERPEARALLESLGDHVKRANALDGDISLDDAERLVEAAREIATYLRSGDEAAYEAARTRLDALL